MKRRVHTACITTAVIAALALSAEYGASSAQAQSTPGAGPGIGARPAAAGSTRQAPGRPAVSPPSPAGEADPALAAPIRRSEPDDRDAATDSVDTSDASIPRQPVLPEDGVLEPPEPQAVVDGLDPNAVDSRAPEDIEALAPREPFAGYDPTIFSIEPDPFLDRRPTQFSRLEPYDPIGIRIGSFILFPEAEFAGAAFSNKFRTNSNVQADTAFEMRPAVRAVSTWSVHALEVSARGFASFHNRFPDEDDRAYTLETRGRLDVTRRTNIEASLSRDIAQEGRGTINAASSGGDRTEIATERAGVTLNHRFNRLAVQLRGAITERDFAPTTDRNGAFISNDERDVTQREAAVRATWSFYPELAVFSEIGLD